MDMLSGEGLSRKNRVISTNFQGFEIEVFKDFGERASNLDKSAWTKRIEGEDGTIAWTRTFSCPGAVEIVNGV